MLLIQGLALPPPHSPRACTHRRPETRSFVDLNEARGPVRRPLHCLSSARPPSPRGQPPLRSSPTPTGPGHPSDIPPARARRDARLPVRPSYTPCTRSPILERHSPSEADLLPQLPPVTDDAIGVSACQVVTYASAECIYSPGVQSGTGVNSGGDTVAFAGYTCGDADNSLPGATSHTCVTYYCTNP
ncbi:hypothetical protein EHS25_001151 [Saitozyma podzolica]|uniref:Uncharacterized protein n=1 Tax=Saitozyma podzolica TaxID=1890683 RepID=A0A427YHD2_9TREE|nr:hypothetical protein EHS25_001151 [Saitozyma podzolica]